MVLKDIKLSSVLLKSSDPVFVCDYFLSNFVLSFSVNFLFLPQGFLDIHFFIFSEFNMRLWNNLLWLLGVLAVG